MPLPFANIALSLAPIAADLATRMFNIKKEAKSKKDLEERLSKLENYEVEQAKLIADLVVKVEQLQKKQKSSTIYIVISLLTSFFLFLLLIFVTFLAS